ncbi:uncharacterized protein VTP21DRAFT_4691 [Calcarisporiella thermophila]|uniref:uncharacterized protein n=1 Tax=Calcarisporiella thermophila TaxID=911321 RepID=UPI003744916D
MEEIQSLLAQATDNLASGDVKNAYFNYLDAMDLISQEMRRVKFVQQTIVLKPANLQSMFNHAHTCIAGVESIFNRHQNAASSFSTSGRHTPTPVGLSIQPPTPFAEPEASHEQHIDDSENKGTNKVPTRTTSPVGASKTPPPLPPKPARKLVDGASTRPGSPVARPPIPPKPFRKPTLKIDPHLAPTSAPTSPANAGQASIAIKASSSEESRAVDEDSDEINEEIIAESTPYALRRTSDAMIGRRESSTSIISPPSRPLTIAVSPLSDSSPTLASTRSDRFSFLSQQTLVNIIPEGSIDPTDLVPAQTSTGDTLAPPSSPHDRTDHVPLIPISPLLIMHRSLQTKLEMIEAKLTEYRNLKRQRSLPGGATEKADEDLDDAIAKHTILVANTKQTLTKLRSIHMTASTVPSIIQFQAHLVAYQLTLIEQAIFLEIPPIALLEHSPKRPNRQITASTDFFNYLTRMIEHMILVQQEASSRVQVIHHWVKVAVKCHELLNFQTLKGILSALSTPPIRRLKRTWAYIPKKSMSRLETLNELMSEDQNYRRYRETIGTTLNSSINSNSNGYDHLSVYSGNKEGPRRPTVPFLGTFIMDITYLLAAVKSSNSSGPTSPSTLLESDPRIQELINKLQYFQSGPKYPPVPPSSYIKANTKAHHFRTPSISLRSSKSSTNRNGYDDDVEGIEGQQQLITHYLLTRAWVHEQLVDELSLLREPPKQKSNNQSGASPSRSSGGAASATFSTSSIVSTPTRSSFYRESTGSIGATGGYSTSEGGGSSRPTSMEESTFSAYDDAPASISSTVSSASTLSSMRPRASSVTTGDSQPHILEKKRSGLGRVFARSFNLDKDKEKEREQMRYSIPSTQGQPSGAEKSKNDYLNPISDHTEDGRTGLNSPVPVKPSLPPRQNLQLQEDGGADSTEDIRMAMARRFANEVISRNS